MASGNDENDRDLLMNLEDTVGFGASIDDVLSVLTDERRRDIVRALDGHDRGMFPGELAALLARREDEPNAERRIHAGLRHFHLPKLEEAGLIERRDDGAIYATERCDLAVDILVAITDAMRPHAIA